MLYEWDLDSDGDCEGDTGTMANNSVSFSSAGSYTLAVRVTDAEGATDTAQAVLTVAVWGQPIDIAYPGETGTEPSLALVDGNPAVAYYEAQQVRLCFTRATDSAGTTWTERLILDHGGNEIGTDPDLEIIDGRPAIANCKGAGTPRGLRFIIAEDATGIDWKAPVLIETNIQGKDPSLAQIDGRPARAYRTNSTEPGFCIAADADGQSWPGQQTLGPLVNADQVSLLNVAGRAAISCTNEGQLVYLRASNDEASAWNSLVILDSNIVAGVQSDMQIVSGVPAIAYNFWTPDLTDFRLKFVRALDAEGLTWSAPVTVATSPSSEYSYSWARLAVVNDNPAITFTPDDGHAQFYVRASNAGGTSWPAISSLNLPGSTVGWVNSLGFIDGLPVVNYGGSLGASSTCGITALQMRMANSPTKASAFQSPRHRRRSGAGRRSAGSASGSPGRPCWPR